MQSTTQTLDVSNVSNVSHIAVPTLKSSSTLVEFTYGVPTLSRKDRRVTDEVLTNKNAESGAGKFTKQLLPNCKELKELQNLGQRIRQTHYRWTLPWSDMGTRLLPMARFPDYNEIMTANEQEFRAGVQAILDVYDWEIIQAKTKLGDLFEPDKYPTLDEFEALFKWNFKYLPVPSAGDFRIDVGDEAVSVLTDNFQQNNQRELMSSMRHVVNEVRESLTKLSNQLQSGKTYDTTVGKPTLLSEDGKTVLHREDGVYRLLELMRTCNLTQDTQIEAARAKLEKQFLGSGLAISREALKEDSSLRDQTQAVVDDVIKSLPTLDM